MKFMVIWTARETGLGSAELIEEQKKSLAALGRWTQPADETLVAQVVRVDGRGGFALTETDSAVALGDAVSKFGPWFDWEVLPVMDLMDDATLNMFGEAVAFHS